MLSLVPTHITHTRTHTSTQSDTRGVCEDFSKSHLNGKTCAKKDRNRERERKSKLYTIIIIVIIIKHIVERQGKARRDETRREKKEYLLK